MEFQIPQFIGREPTVAVGITFRQFITLGVAGGSIFIIFFLLRNLFLFTVMAIAIGAVAVIFSFLQVGGQSFPVVFKNFVSYFFKPRVYVWRKKGMPEKIIKPGQPEIIISEPEEAGEEKRKIGVTKEGQLKKLWERMETK